MLPKYFTHSLRLGIKRICTGVLLFKAFCRVWDMIAWCLKFSKITVPLLFYNFPIISFVQWLQFFFLLLFLWNPWIINCCLNIFLVLTCFLVNLLSFKSVFTRHNSKYFLVCEVHELIYKSFQFWAMNLGLIFVKSFYHFSFCGLPRNYNLPKRVDGNPLEFECYLEPLCVMIN